MSRRPLRIGLSARIYHPVAGATGLQSKSLQYLEQSVAHWVMSRDVMVFMIPAVSGDAMVHRSSIRLSDYPGYLDGLILQGGADISPQSYGEEPSHPDWAGDRVRDAYEMELLHEFMEAGKAVLGICRGAQLINVALGGTLYQDIATQIETAGAAPACRLRPAQPCDRVGRQVRPGEALSGHDRRAGGVDTSSGDQGPGSGTAGRSAQQRGRPDRSHSPAGPTVCAWPAVAPGVPSARQRGSAGLHAHPRRVPHGRARPFLVSASQRC
jgi:gamma-glutamyl-gamma-aminobutyrate hydrolase PuuD